MAVEQLLLPTGIVTRADVGRLMREAEAVDSVLTQTAIRTPGTAVALPKTSQLLDEMIAANKLNLLQPADRQRLLASLQTIRAGAPTLHMSFNTDPSPVFQQKLIVWIRQQIHPAMLLHIGLHPNIGAGCVVRTDNKFFDFSLRQRFSEKRGVLIDKLRGEQVAKPAGESAASASVSPVAPVVPSAPTSAEVVS